MEEKNLYNHEYYTNRELSWLQFNERVLGEARDKNIPLLERVKFLAITASNLDEFFMIRVASLMDMVHAGYDKKDIAGLTPQRQLSAIGENTHKLVDMQYSTYARSLIPALKKEGIRFVTNADKLNDEQEAYIDRYFLENVYPVLTPMAVDSSRPFPLIRNKSLNIGALLSKKRGNEEIEFATVQVPSVLDRIIRIPDEEQELLILLEDVILRNMDRLFLNYDVLCAYPFRIMRNADLTIEEDEAADLLKEIEKQIKKRQWGEVIRLEVAADADNRLIKILKRELAIKDEAIYRINGPLDLTFLMKMYDIKGHKRLKSELFVPILPELFRGEGSIFEKIRKQDILLHHPYEDFSPIISFVREAAADPSVLAIKQTLYRVSGNSPIIEALAAAAENGKQVTVLVELKARFDEEHNIVWARKLEKAGCHVIYGLVGLKTHCKITLVVRKEKSGIKRYVHLGTGNYNDATAKLYTDLGLLTCKEQFGEDATAVFNMLSGYSEPLLWNKLSLAPLWLKDRFLELIRRETENAKQGKKAGIIAKLNSICDADIIAALYEASNAGVKIQLIVRGICCLRVGIKGVSENITVRSVVGYFLEHSRIFCFENAGNREIYCASADWMPRNLERRVEILFPIEEDEHKERILHILNLLLEDNVKARIMLEDGSYVRAEKHGKKAISAQNILCEEAKRVKVSSETEEKSRLFIPEGHIQ